jgi:hypothetical protein
MSSRGTNVARVALSLALGVVLLAVGLAGVHRHDGPANTACQICHAAQFAALVPLAAAAVTLAQDGWRMPLLEPPLASESFLQSRHSRAPPE